MALSSLKQRGYGSTRGMSNVLAAILVIALILIGLYAAGIVKFEVAPQQPSKPTAPATPAAPGVYAGAIALYQKCFDGFDVATTYTHGTNYNVYWFVNRAGSWIQLASGDATVELTEVDGGYVYALVSVPAGQSFYVDYQSTQQKNFRVQNVLYQDITNDGVKDFVFRIWVGDVPRPSSGNPQYTFYPYLRAYQKPSINTPADQTGIGTAASARFIEWYLSFTNTKKSFIITKVVISFNTTDVTKIDLDNVNIPGLGFVSGSQFSYTRLANSIEYTYTIGSDLSNGLWLNYGANQLNKFPFDTKVTTHFASGDVIAATITIYGLTPTGTLTTITDTVVLAA